MQARRRQRVGSAPTQRPPDEPMRYTFQELGRSATTCAERLSIGFRQPLWGFQSSIPARHRLRFLGGEAVVDRIAACLGDPRVEHTVAYAAYNGQNRACLRPIITQLLPYCQP